MNTGEKIPMKLLKVKYSTMTHFLEIKETMVRED
jgi:hypothetical protein